MVCCNITRLIIKKARDTNLMILWGKIINELIIKVNLKALRKKKAKLKSKTIYNIDTNTYR